jgi:hypothetical protein
MMSLQTSKRSQQFQKFAVLLSQFFSAGQATLHFFPDIQGVATLSRRLFVCCAGFRIIQCTLCYQFQKHPSGTFQEAVSDRGEHGASQHLFTTAHRRQRPTRSEPTRPRLNHRLHIIGVKVSTSYHVHINPALNISLYTGRGKTVQMAATLSCRPRVPVSLKVCSCYRQTCQRRVPKGQFAVIKRSARRLKCLQINYES